MSNVMKYIAEFDGLIDNHETVDKVAEFLRQPEVRNNIPFLAQMSDNALKLLSLSCAAQWPEAEAALFADFVSAIPYQYPEHGMPCGAKEIFILNVLGDNHISKAVKSSLWKKFISRDYCFPRYEAKQTWTIPPELIDQPEIRRWIVLTRQPGWEDFRNTDILFFKNNPPIDPEKAENKEVLKSLENDSVATLLLPLSIKGKNVPKKYFKAALWKGAVQIVIYLYTHIPAMKQALPPRDLLLFVCANWESKKTIQAVEMLEKMSPGIVAQTRDFRGHDALWYTIYQQNKSASLTETLIHFGCKPNRKQIYGLLL